MKSLKDGEWLLDTNKELGSGNFAKVFMGYNASSKQQVAIKQISNNKVAQYGEKLETAIQREIDILKAVSRYENPYLLKILDSFETSNNRYLVLEFCNNGTLQDVLNTRKRIPEEEAIKIAYQIVLGLSAMNDLQIVHRDMKPDNIFIHNDTYKIGDFGFANQASKFVTQLGTCIYMGPEFYIGTGNMDSGVDIWAFGVILHQMLFGEFAFNGTDQRMVINKVINQEYRTPKYPEIRSETKDLLQKCLIKNPEERIKMENLRNHRVTLNQLNIIGF